MQGISRDSAGNLPLRTLQLTNISVPASLFLPRLGSRFGFSYCASRFFAQSARLLNRLTRDLPHFREIVSVLRLVSHGLG